MASLQGGQWRLLGRVPTSKKKEKKPTMRHPAATRTLTNVRAGEKRYVFFSFFLSFFKKKGYLNSFMTLCNGIIGRSCNRLFFLNLLCLDERNAIQKKTFTTRVNKYLRKVRDLISNLREPFSRTYIWAEGDVSVAFELSLRLPRQLLIIFCISLLNTHTFSFFCFRNESKEW